jgi:hypothetical protein
LAQQEPLLLAPLELPVALLVALAIQLEKNLLAVSVAISLLHHHKPLET